MKRKTLSRLGALFLLLAIVFSIGIWIGVRRINDEEYWNAIEHNLNRHGEIDTIRKTQTMKTQFQNMIYPLVIPMAILYILALICFYNSSRKFKQDRL